MHYLYMLYWERQAQNSFNYGSDIQYLTNRDVMYSNILQSPGDIIHAWSPAHLIQDKYAAIFLPFLHQQTDYDVQIAADTVPQFSIGVKIRAFNNLGEIQTERLISGFQGSFRFTRETTTYSISLVNLNNAKLYFHHIVLAEH